MRWFLVLMTMIIVSGCNKNPRSISYVPSEKQKLANEIRKKAAFELKKEKELYPCGSGGQMMHEIQMLALSFDYYKSINIAEGRELLIAAVEKFTTVINADDRIRPYLGNYPFEPKNIEVRIFLQNRNISEPNQLIVISALEGVLEYDVRDPQTTRLTTVYKESYEEALRLSQSVATDEKKNKIMPIEDRLGCVSQDFVHLK